ncbi:MAG TPA: glycosyltransferase family 1 protein, partial [Stellaceae bacterium]|nr:glycosyltransferase family 1 protein [Stellaceae bacterium]
HSPLQMFSCFDFSLPSLFHLHDLQHLYFPENFSAADIAARNHSYGLSANLASAVIASTAFVRQAIIERLHVPPTKVLTLPVTWNPEVADGLRRFTPEAARAAYRLPQHFGLFPGQFWVHKNHARLVEALFLVRRRLPQLDFKLVFTGYRGHAGWKVTEATIARLNLEREVITLDYVPTEHMAALYKGASFCVMPSTFEASSYPVLEAQMLGCPAMCSDVTSLPELMAGEAGLLFDPLSPEDMADKMCRWLMNPEEAHEFAERALVKVRREHSFSTYRENLAAIYRQLDPR